MDLETYRTVLAWKLQRKLSTVKQWGYDEAELALRQDMAALKVVWYNHFLKDWWWCAPPRGWAAQRSTGRRAHARPSRRRRAAKAARAYSRPPLP